MNEFIEQFLLESRELVAQATQDLLALEKTPADKELLDSAFRSFHTLKGGAGIVDFTAMADAVHAAEDVLAAARSGSRSITAELIGDCLACLDQVEQWLDLMQGTGKLPADAEQGASAIVAHFARSAGDGKSQTPAPAGVTNGNWLEALLAKHPAQRALAQTAIRYAPDADCFFRDEDPVALIAAIPGLLCVELAAATPWGPLDAIDPFVCNLVITALTQNPADEAAATLADVAHQCEIQTLAAAGATAGAQMPVSPAREVLQAQVDLLAATGAQGVAGRIASAGAVAANILRYSGNTQDIDALTQATAAALAGKAPDILRAAIEAVINAGASAVAVQPAPAPHDVAARTLRVDAARIDALVSLTGELTVAKNAVGHAAKLAQEGGNVLASVLKDKHAVLDRLIGELQQAVLGMRVLPLRHVFQRFPRLLREMSGSLGKPANLVIEGGDTEADKAIVEMLFEPLLHVLRNAMDHGIENAAERLTLNKPPVATIRLSAAREGDHVAVEVSDDGRGVDVARVRQVALERNVTSAEALAAMSDGEITDLIFAPGFSTAAEVTGLSGRGVGMDAVRTAVERLGGHVGVESRAGAGTSVRFTLPFSVMMTRVMIVEAGGQKFGIPLDAMVETVRVAADRIAPVGAAHAIVLRNQTIPLVELAGALGVKREGREDAEATIVVTRLDGQLGALRVDRLDERMELMLKPLDGLLAGMRGIAGSTLLGDGSVLLVLDLGEIFQ